MRILLGTLALLGLAVAATGEDDAPPRNDAEAVESPKPEAPEADAGTDEPEKDSKKSDVRKKTGRRRGAAAIEPRESEPAVAPPGYMIGVHCTPVSPALRAQLDLAEGNGLSVDEVLEGSPADKVGIRPHDVLIGAGGKELSNLPDLTEAVQAAGKAGEELSLVLIRGGEKRTLSVATREIPGTPIDEEERRRFELHLGDGRAPGHPGRGFRFQMVRPGIAIDIGRPVELPDDVEVTITKKGKLPATVRVTLGDEVWEAVEGKIDELPDEVRPWVRRALSSPEAGRGFERHRRLHGPPEVFREKSERPDVDIPEVPEAESTQKPAEGPAIGEPEQNIEQRLEETLKQLEALRRSVEDLQSKVRKPGAPQ